MESLADLLDGAATVNKTPTRKQHSVSSAAASPSGSNLGSARKSAIRNDTSTAALPMRIGSAGKHHQSFASPHGSQQQTMPRTPKVQTPKKVEWTTDKLEERIRTFWNDVEEDGAKLTSRLIHMAWKKGAPEKPDPKNIAKKNWFADMKRIPMPAGDGTMKIKTKQLGPGRVGKQEKREHFKVICIKTNKDPVPNYKFHHVEISKNILSPNTMLNFVPHLRDLADEEEPKYRKWLQSLENMDKQSGFATLSRQEKVVKTCQKERATILLLYLDTWLGSLGLEDCTKSTLIRHMASQTDSVTPQQKSSILNSYTDASGSSRSARAVKMFTEAFNRVFNHFGSREAVTLRDVLLLDKSVDTIVDSKKWMKDTPNQAKALEVNTTVESFLETYSILGCLICCNHSCEHGDYGVDNSRLRLSVDVVGGLEPLLRKKAVLAAQAQGKADNPRKPCGDDCYMNGRFNTRARQWTDTETMLLRTFIATLCDTNIPVQCATAVATGRPCWDVNRQLEKLDITPPSASPPPTPNKVKSVHWYDRYKKTLIGDWQEQTLTNEYARRDCFDYCSHDGPCTEANCSCVQAHVMCERFCRCTVDICPTKFTGCACHSLGKTCLPKQKERPCICVQLNRECDPMLCGSCGARDRADPRNADDDELFAHGCQNCVMQRGKSKSLVLGKSMIENCGYGLFTAEDIAQDDFVIEYVGELITQDEGVRREARRGDVFDEESNTSYLFTLLEQEGIWVDAAIYGNLSRYINHQDDTDKRGLGCNITPRILYVCGEYRIKFTAMRDIKAGEELFFNYGENFPNLTKKVFFDGDGKKDGPRKGRPRKKRAESDEEEADQRLNRKAGKGKHPAGKHKKKAATKTAAVTSEEPEEDEAMEDFLLIEEPIPKSRKRKRHPDDDSEEDEYRPEIADSEDTHSAATKDAPARGRPRGRPKNRLKIDKPMMRKSANHLSAHGNNSGLSSEEQPLPPPQAEKPHRKDSEQEDDHSLIRTPNRRIKRPRKLVEDPWHEDEDDESDLHAFKLDHHHHHDGDSAVEEEYTPSRMRTRHSLRTSTSTLHHEDRDRERDGDGGAASGSEISHGGGGGGSHGKSGAVHHDRGFWRDLIRGEDDEDAVERESSANAGEEDSDGSLVIRSSRVRRRPKRYSD